MKKILALLAILTLAVSAFAQYIPDAKEVKQVDTAALMKKNYNVRGGMNFSSLSMAYSSGRYRSNSSLGFHIGGMMDMPLALVDIANDAYLISVHPGAQFTKKGGKRSVLSLLYGFKYEIDAYYIEFPVLFSFKRNFSDNFAARADLGPYLAIGLFGSQDYGFGSYEESESSFSENGLNRMDGGMYYGVTMDFAKRYSVGFHAGSGFTDDNIYTVYITLGYKL